MHMSCNERVHLDCGEERLCAYPGRKKFYYSIKGNQVTLEVYKMSMQLRLFLQKVPSHFECVFC